MKYLIALVVVIAILAYYLNRRGREGLGGGTETTDRALGQSHRQRRADQRLRRRLSLQPLVSGCRPR